MKMKFVLISMNADLIRQGLSPEKRLEKLRSMAYYQLHSLQSSNAADRLKVDIQNRIETN